MMRPLSSLFLLTLVGNAALLWIGYYWLGLGEAHLSTLLWSLLVALVGCGLAIELHGATFAYFHQRKDAHVPVAIRTALRHLPALVTVAVLASAIYYGLSAWNGYSSTPAFRIASYLTLKLRKPVKPASVLQIFHGVVWLVRWVLVPAILLPAISLVAGIGWRGFAALKPRGGRHWVLLPILLLLAFWVPWKLMGWTPRPASFALQVMSFGLRFGLAYLLFVAAWLSAAFIASGGSPRFSQSKTVVSP